jgi:Dolichyl-phosphate-mannose-protein mannosyltransferase
VPISRLPVKLVLQIVLLLAASVIGFLYLQMCHGGFTSDLGGDPDEAAHAVTALMVRDYLVGSLGTSPLAFASNYYEIFPKVALGHYPPGYYLPAAIALSLSCSPGVLIAMQAVWAATLAMLGWLFARRWITEGDGLLATFPALILLLNNEVVRVGCHVLSDLQLAALVFAAFWAWHQYLRRPSWRAGLAFGFLAAAAILTKGSAMGLAGVPLLTVLLGRRWQDVKTFHWWASAIPVLFLAGPWMAYSVRFTQEGFVDQNPLSFFIQALSYYREVLPRVLGWPVAILLLFSFARLLRDNMQNKVDAPRLVLWSGVLSMQGLVMVVPTGFSPRYLLPCLLPAALLALIELFFLTPLLCSKLRNRFSPILLVRLLVIALTIGTVFLTANTRPKWVSGFSESVARLFNKSASGKKGIWLVSSDPRGEGALIAAAAFGVDDRSSAALRIHRGSKDLVDTDWIGKGYEPRFTDSASILAILDQLKVDTVMVDLSMPFEHLKPHETMLKRSLDTPASGWQLAWKQSIQRGRGIPDGDLWVYQRTVSGGTPK